MVNANRNLNIPGYYEVYNDGMLSILENRYAKKRAYFPRSVKVVDNEPDALRGVFDLPSIRGDQTIIEGDPAAGVSVESGSLSYRKDPDQTVEIVDYSSNRVGLRAKLTSDAWIILTDSFYPGWKAWVDDEPTKVYRADCVYQGVFLSAGRHTVRFRCVPNYLREGALISLAGMMLLAVSLFVWWRGWRPGGRDVVTPSDET